MDKLLLRPLEAAEMLGIGRSNLYKLLKSGELPSITIGGSVRVPVEALREWIARQTTPRRVEAARQGRVLEAAPVEAARESKPATLDELGAILRAYRASRPAAFWTDAATRVVDILERGEAMAAREACTAALRENPSDPVLLQLSWALDAPDARSAAAERSHNVYPDV